MQDATMFNQRKQICTAWNQAVKAWAELHGLVRHEEVRGFVQHACDGPSDLRTTVLARSGNPSPMSVLNTQIHAMSADRGV